MGKDGEKKDYTISTEITCTDGSKLKRKRLKTEADKPDGELPRMKRERAVRACAAFAGAFMAAFWRELKVKATKENKGEIEETKFILLDSDGKRVAEILLSKDEIEKTIKK